MKFPNLLIRYMIKVVVVLIMLMSLPVKLFNMFFRWREEKQQKLASRSPKKLKVEHPKFYS